ncbi:MAG: GNAT family N-acetyltransferase [Marinilabiliales bacterium]|nr:GNAT family N-acetyltransferase [Marinilabiliales bacterium]
MKPFLKNDLIQLRALEPDDIDRLYEWENDEENWTISHTITPFSRHLLELYIASADKDLFETRQLRLMIVTNEGLCVGAIDLFDFDPYHGRAGIGILVHRMEDRAKGYATAALTLMIRYCFEKLNLHQLYANILTDHTISLRLFQQAGFVMTGTKKSWIREGAVWKDEHLLQLVANPD